MEVTAKTVRIESSGYSSRSTKTMDYQDIRKEVIVKLVLTDMIRVTVKIYSVKLF